MVLFSLCLSVWKGQPEGELIGYGWKDHKLNKEDIYEIVLEDIEC